MNKRKILVTVLALGLVVTAFAAFATPVSAANPKNWHFYDFVNFIPRLRDTTSDTMDPHDGVARWMVTTIPGEVNTDFTNDLGAPISGMSAWIGPNGRA